MLRVKFLLENFKIVVARSFYMNQIARIQGMVWYNGPMFPSQKPSILHWYHINVHDVLTPRPLPESFPNWFMIPSLGLGLRFAMLIGYTYSFLAFTRFVMGLLHWATPSICAFTTNLLVTYLVIFYCAAHLVKHVLRIKLHWLVVDYNICWILFLNEGEHSIFPSTYGGLYLLTLALSISKCLPA